LVAGDEFLPDHKPFLACAKRLLVFARFQPLPARRRRSCRTDIVASLRCSLISASS
jgi:hypothetical protein